MLAKHKKRIILQLFSYLGAWQQASEQQDSSKPQHEAIAEQDIGRRASIPLHPALQRGCSEYFRFLYYLAAFIDNGCHTSIGSTQHVAAGFQRAHLRNLQVLPGADGPAEPGIIADVGEQSGLR